MVDIHGAHAGIREHEHGIRSAEPDFQFSESPYFGIEKAENSPSRGSGTPMPTRPSHLGQRVVYRRNVKLLSWNRLDSRFAEDRPECPLCHVAWMMSDRDLPTGPRAGPLAINWKPNERSRRVTSR